MFPTIFSKKFKDSKLHPNFNQRALVLKEYIAEADFFRSGSFSEAISNGESVVFLDPALQPNQPSPSHHGVYSNLNPITVLRSTPFWEIAFKTSGSEGKPKLFLKTKKEIFAEVDFLKIFLKEIYFLPRNISLGEISFLVSIPLCHIYGFLWGYVLPLDMGIKAKDCKTLSSIRNELISNTQSLEKLGSNKGLIWITVPSQLEALFDLLDPSKVNLKDTLIIVSGSRMKKKSALDFQNKFSTSILEIYGSTETGGIGYRFPADSQAIQLFNSIEAKILDQRLAIRSPFLHPELIKNGGDSIGYFLTDDLGELIGNEFTYQGRMGRIIKKKGKRIHLDMIENLLLEFPSVKDAIVVDFPEEQIGALIQGELSRIELESIPSILLPDKMIQIDSVPKLPNGKKDYQIAKTLFH